MSLWTLCLEGGWIMLILAALLLLSIYVFVERVVALRNAERAGTTSIEGVRELLREGRIDTAIARCRRAETIGGRVLAKGLSRVGRPMSEVQAAMENVGNAETASLSKGLPLLATTAAAAPMLGFLGTVTGMVKAFYGISRAGSSATIDSFASGIYSALVTTVAGLIVGIIALFAYNWLLASINRLVNAIEAQMMEFMDMLNESAD